MTTATAAPDVSQDIATVNQIKAEMSVKLIERPTEIDMMVLSVIAREHGVLIGVPGVAKSMTVREFMSRIVDAIYFETLFRKSLPVEEVVGPVSLQGLTQDVFRYITTGKMPESNVAFLDEVWKANAVVLNSLLTILNERKFKNNGTHMDVPLWCAIGASNELPTEQELMAIRDRFAWCVMVEPVKTDDGFKEIMRGQIARRAGQQSSGPRTTITKDAIERLQSAASRITVGDDVLNDIASMRRSAESQGLHVSPRRYGSGLNLAIAKALLNGRDYVVSDDLRVFQHVLWTHEEDRATAIELTLDFAGKVAKEASKLRSAFEPIKVDILAVRDELKATGNLTEDTMNKIAPLSVSLRDVERKVGGEIDDATAAGKDPAELGALLQEVKAIKEIIRNEIMG